MPELTVAIGVHLAVHVCVVLAGLGLMTVAVGGPVIMASRVALAISGLLLIVGGLLGGVLADVHPALSLWLQLAAMCTLAAAAAAAASDTRTDRAGVGMPLAVALPVGMRAVAPLAAVAASVAIWRGGLDRIGPARILIVAPLASGLAVTASANTALVMTSTTVMALSVLGWVAFGMRPSFAIRVGSLAALAVALVAIGIGSATGQLIGSDVVEDETNRLGIATDDLTAEITDRVPLRLLSTSQSVADVVAVDLERADPESARLDVRAAQIAGLEGVDVSLLLTERGVVGSHDRRTSGSVSAVLAQALEQQLVVDELGATAVAGMIRTPDGQLFAFAAASSSPLIDGVVRQDRIAGHVVTARRISAAQRLQVLSARVDALLFVVSQSDVVATSTPDSEGPPAVEIADAAQHPSSTTDGYLWQSRPLTEDGTAMLVTARPRDVAGVRQTLLVRRLFLIVIAALLLAAAAAMHLGAAAARDVVSLTHAAEHIARGNWIRLPQVSRRRRTDEVGRLADAFDTMSNAVQERESALMAAAVREGSLRARLQAVTEAMSDGLMVSSTDGSIEMVNPAAKRFGFSAGDDLEQTLVAAGADADLAGALSMGTGEGSFEVAGRSVIAVGAPIRVDDGAGVVVVFRDVTAEVQAERMKAQFLANVSHELRTPLTPILGFARITKSLTDDERIIDFAERIHVAGTRLERVVAMLVDHAEVQSGRFTSVDGSVDLPSTLQRTIDGVGAVYGSDRIAADVADAPAFVRADHRVLLRVLYELLDNACKFSQDVVTVVTNVSADVVTIRIHDRGPGLPEHVADGIRHGTLDDFRQHDGTDTRAVDGLGLGLALAVSLAGRAGLSLGFETGPTGTIVSLDLQAAATPGMRAQDLEVAA